MSSITLEEVIEKAGVSLDILKETECADEDLLELARFCDNWRLIGSHLKLSEDQLSAIDGDYKLVDEKRLAVLRGWKQFRAFFATYLELIMAFLACHKVQNAFKVCQLFKNKYCQSETISCKYQLFNSIMAVSQSYNFL